MTGNSDQLAAGSIKGYFYLKVLISDSSSFDSIVNTVSEKL